MSIEQLREAYSRAAQAVQDAVAGIEAAEEGADLDALQATFDAAEADANAAKANLERFERVEAAKQSHKVPVIQDTPKTPRVEVTSEPLTYTKQASREGRSIFRDMLKAGMGDHQAAERLERHKREMYDLSSTDAAGGQLVAPLHLQEEFVDLATAGRVVANIIGSKQLPPNTDSINIPKLSTGTAVGNQADNAAVTETDATFGTLAADVKTIAGMQDVSQQLLDRSVPGVDEVIYADLLKRYNIELDSKVISNSTANNKGLLDAGGSAVTYTDASPTVGELYAKLADAIQQIHTNVFAAPNAVFMHPRRWAWVLAALDTTNRPLVTPYAPQNASGSHGGVSAEGPVGSIQGLPVYVDANIPTNLGAGTNEDRILVARTDELFIWEEQSGPFLETFRDVGSGTLTVRLRLHNYWAQLHERRPKAVSIISGTGLVAPTF